MSAWDRIAAHAPKSVFEFVLAGDPAVVVKVYDGDTVHLAFDYRGQVVRVRCRLAGIDAPELRRVDPRGAAARDALAAITSSARLRAWSFGVDKYGRTLVQLELPDKRSVARMMINMGHARPYTGGTREPW